MKHENNVGLVGIVASEPRVLPTRNGSHILKMRVSTTEYLQSARGDYERTEYHSVTMFGGLAEQLGRELQKGDLVRVEGSLRTSSYEKNGQKMYSTEVIARIIKPYESKKPRSNLEASNVGSSKSSSYFSPEVDSDIPF